MPKVVFRQAAIQDKDGKTVYTTEVVVENQEFAESKATADSNNEGGISHRQPVASQPTAPAGDGFMNIPDSVDDVRFTI